MKDYKVAKRWQDGFGLQETRIMAADLIHMEEGISAATQGVTNTEKQIEALPEKIMTQVRSMRADTLVLLDVIAPIGSIIMYGGSKAPERFLMCDGKLVDRNVYQKLFEVIGTTYGSTNASDFRLPDFRERSPIGALGGSKYDLNDKGGNSTINLTVAQMPAHTHDIGEVGNANARFTARTAKTDIGIGTDGYTYLTSTGTTSGDRSPIAASAGNGAPVDVRHPYIGTNFIIRYK